MLTRAAARIDLHRAGVPPLAPMLGLATLYAAECGPLDATDARYDGPSSAQAARHNGWRVRLDAHGCQA